MTKRIGILGGTFDPIHFAHLAIAEEARVALGLNQVLLVPAARQPLKTHAPGASASDRLAMVRLACAHNAALEPSAIELDRTDMSYTVTTLEALHEAHLGELYFILGADALIDLPRWHAVTRLLELTQIVCIARPQVLPQIEALQRELPALAERLTLLEGPRMDLSSSELRRRVVTGLPIRYLTPDPVVEYIQSHRLYQRDPAAGLI